MDLLASPLDELMAEARAVRDARSGGLVTYSPKVFIPLTKLCRDVCHYCTFARPAAARGAGVHDDRRGARRSRGRASAPAAARRSSRSATSPSCATARRATSSPRSGARPRSSTWSARRGPCSRRPSLLPHLNPGVLTADDFELLRPVAASMGLMLETTSERLSARGGPHFGSPDKLPAARLETLRLAGEARVPFTTGILIGIGETREERLDALRAIAARGAARAGGDRAELPREARHADGRRARAAARGAALDDRGGAARPAAGGRGAGAAEPDRRVRGAARRGHRRLGRRLAGHDRPRQPRGAVAGGRGAARRVREPRARAGAAPHRLSAAPRRRSGWTRACCRGRCARRTRSGSRGRTRGRRADDRVRLPFVVSRDPLPRAAGRELAEDEIARLFRARGSERQRVFADGGRAAARGERRHRHATS